MKLGYSGLPQSGTRRDCVKTKPFKPIGELMLGVFQKRRAPVSREAT